MSFKAALGFFASLAITALLSAGPLRAEPLKLVGFGDSLMAGYQLPATDAFPAKLEKALRDKGHAVEIAGYQLSPALAGGLEQASLDVPADYTGRIAWFEMCAGDEPRLSPAAMRVIERLQARHVEVNAEALIGPAFWQTVEIEESAELLERSRVALTAAAPWPAPVTEVASAAAEASR